MRPSLLPGLIAAARRNLDRGAASVRLFEVGRRYLADGERPTAALLLAGERSPRGWQAGKAQDFDAFDAKAEALALLEAAGAPVHNLQLFMDAGPTWHPGRSAKLGLGPKTVLAAFGELHPSIARGLPADGRRRTLSRRDPGAALGRPGARRLRAAGAAGGDPRLRLHRPGTIWPPTRWSARFAAPTRRRSPPSRLFDRYQPEGGELSLAVEVTLQPGDKSFTDAEIAEIAKRIVAAAEKLGRAAARLVVQRVDRGVDPRFDLVALEARRDDLADPEADRARPLDEAAVPDPAAVERDRHHRQAERAVEAGEARRAAARSPSGTRVPSGKMTTGRPLLRPPGLASASISRSALAPASRSTPMTP